MERSEVVTERKRKKNVRKKWKIRRKGKARQTQVRRK